MWHREGEACDRVEPRRCADCLAPTFGDWLASEDRDDVVGSVHRQALDVLNRAAALIVPSARAIPPFTELGADTARFRVVENGVDTANLRQLPLATRPDGAPLRIGYLGTLLPSKGLDVLVEAFKSLEPGAARLDIWGNSVPYHGDTGFTERVLERLAPDDQATYHGPYQTADLPEILAEVDVVVAPALWREAFGLTVREGLAAGRPVVVSRIGGLQDAITDGGEGFVVEPGDPEALAGALGRLADDPALYQRMAEAARGRARGFAEMAAELTDIYQGLVGLDPR